jgi:hypothetical protein
MKIVINRSYGGFGLSRKAVMRYAELKGIKLRFVVIEHRENESFDEDRYWSVHDIDRSDPALVQVVEELGPESFGTQANLKVVDIPDDVEWKISGYDCMEQVEEVHRSWY